MNRVRQAWITDMENFRGWNRNPRIIMTFCLGFAVSFLLSDKVLVFADEHNIMLQIFEPFIWTFGDADSVLVISLLLMLLFADMPKLNNDAPFFLVRTSRMTWMLGQILYLVSATLLFMCFILFSTCVLVCHKAYIANLWSNTAAVLGYSDIGEQIAVPSFVKVLELSFPYTCMAHIFGLMLGYSVLMAGIMLYLNLLGKNCGMIGGIVFSGFGFILKPDIIAEWFHISRENIKLANIAFGWLSPLNHATYYMHNFGYDNLPKLWVSYLFFSAGSLIFFVLSVMKIRSYSFNFTGTQR